MRLKPFRIERPGCRAVMQLEVYEEPTGLVCGIYRLRGRIDLPRREWIAAVREEMHKIEGLAKAANCTSRRVSGLG